MNNLDITKFKKKNDFLLCIDSDGTVIDAMNAKHLNCHGPAFINEWDLQEHKDEIQKIWNDINLFEETRGVNRFIALVKILKLLNGKYLNEPNIDVLNQWVENTTNLSNKGLEDFLEKNHNPLLAKALQWSYEINKRIEKLSTADKPPFLGVEEFLSFAKGKVDIAVVSSSNMDAIYNEWGDHNLIQYLDVMTSQEIGTKGECVAQMISKGYRPDHVMMIGDANPDVDAAKENSSFFYPILTTREEYSWNQLQNKYFSLFINGEFRNFQTEVLDLFQSNFRKKEKL